MTETCDAMTLPVGRVLIVKFTKHYCEDAHQLLAENGLAPLLYRVEVLHSGWKMIIMESIGWQTLHSFKENLTNVSSGAATNNTTQLLTENQIKVPIRQNVNNAVTLLHENGFVHGDLRPNNILVNPAGEIRIIDFDFAGNATGSDQPFLNMNNGVHWAEGATRGGLLKRAMIPFYANQFSQKLLNSLLK